MSSTLAVDKINTGAGLPGIDVLKFSTGGSYIRQIIPMVDATAYSSAGAWTVGPSFGITVPPQFKAKSLIKLYYNIPVRNDGASWGGCYLEPQLDLGDGKGWQSLGGSGFSSVMIIGPTGRIGYYDNTIIVDPAMVADFTVKVRIMFASYNSGPITINSGVAVNTVSGTGTAMTGVNYTQHFAKVILEEVAPY